MESDGSVQIPKQTRTIQCTGIGKWCGHCGSSLTRGQAEGRELHVCLGESILIVPANDSCPINAAIADDTWEKVFEIPRDYAVARQTIRDIEGLGYKIVYV